MITKLDRRSLNHQNWRGIGIWCIPVFFLLVTVFQLNATARLVKPIEYSVTDIIDIWYSKPDSTEVHTLTAMALIRVERAFGFFCMSLVFFVIAVLDSTFTRRRDERLIMALKEAGKW